MEVKIDSYAVGDEVFKVTDHDFFWSGKLINYFQGKVHVNQKN